MSGEPRYVWMHQLATSTTESRTID